MSEEPLRRLALVGIPADAADGFMAVLKGQAHCLNLPDDATIYRMAYDVETDRVIFLIESQAYQEHRPGEPVPWVDLLFRRVDPV